MNLLFIPGGRAGQLFMFSILLGTALLILWTVVIASSESRSTTSSDASDTNRYHYSVNMDRKKLPRLSADKKTLVVTSEEALPNAFQFLRLNMYLPIEKIVLLKPGMNDTVKVYPIPREGMIGLGGNNLPLSFSEIGLIGLFLIFIIGSFAYIFTIITGTRMYWDDEGWWNYEDLCLDGEDDVEDKKLLVKAERKSKELGDIMSEKYGSARLQTKTLQV